MQFHPPPLPQCQVVCVWGGRGGAALQPSCVVQILRRMNENNILIQFKHHFLVRWASSSLRISEDLGESQCS